MKKHRILAASLAVVSLLGFAGCGSSATSSSAGTSSSNGDTAAATTQSAEELGYTYGVNTQFYSNEPVNYSMLYSDNEAYPYSADWLFWSELTKRTNVSLDLNVIARSDYDDKKSLLINSGESAYIIPKTYDESAFVTGGAIVPISDWTQYMPNYTAFVEKYNLQEDLKQITKEDGKYYRLPGMWEAPKNEYTWVIRKDIFEAAGVDIAELEKNYTWDTFTEALEKVAAKNPGKTVWSDKWKGDSALKVIGNAYNVPAGWAKNDGMWYDKDKDQFYFAETTDDCKNMCIMLNKLIKDGVLDPETFTQEDQTADTKFYNGDTFMIGTNESTFGTYITNLNSTLGEGNYELYILVPPTAQGKDAYQVENTRLENGIMISQKALDELGEKDFIKMLRFIDWLWYSEDAQTFTKWGVEGTTYTEDNGVKTLMDGIGYGAVNPDAPKKLNNDFGFGNGVFMYGGTTANRVSMLSQSLQDFNARLTAERAVRPLSPAVAFNEEEIESMNLIKTPLMDYVSTSTMQFITGQKDISTEWDAYVGGCKSSNCDSYVKMYNDAYARSKN